MPGPTLRELGWIVARDVNRTVGGGLASMELLRRTFARAGWLDARGHALFVAVSRFTPGTNLLAYCLVLGWRFERWPGALMALAASSMPAAALVAGLMATLVRVDDYPVVRVLQAVGVLVATGLVILSAWHLIRPYARRSTWLLPTVIGVLAVVLILLDVTPVRVLMASAAVGFCLPVAPEGRDAAVSESTVQ
jgi:chromate transporter